VERFLSGPPAQLSDDLRRWARKKLHEMVDAEALLWKLLRNRRLAGAKFMRRNLAMTTFLRSIALTPSTSPANERGEHGAQPGM